MDKKVLVHNFEDEDISDVLNLYEKYLLALEKDITIFSNRFYAPNIWTFFKKNFETTHNLIGSLL